MDFGSTRPLGLGPGEYAAARKGLRPIFAEATRFDMCWKKARKPWKKAELFTNLPPAGASATGRPDGA